MQIFQSKTVSGTCKTIVAESTRKYWYVNDDNAEIAYILEESSVSIRQ